MKAYLPNWAVAKRAESPGPGFLVLEAETEGDRGLLDRLDFLFNSPGWSEADRLALAVLMTYGRKREIAAALLDEVLASFHADVANERYVTRGALLDAINKARELHESREAEAEAVTLGWTFPIPQRVWLLVLDAFKLARSAEPRKVSA